MSPNPPSETLQKWYNIVKRYGLEWRDECLEYRPSRKAPLKTADNFEWASKTLETAVF